MAGAKPLVSFAASTGASTLAAPSRSAAQSTPAIMPGKAPTSEKIV